MRILAGQDQEYEGTLQLSPGIKVGYLQQEPKLDMNSTVLENIAPALAPTKAMLTEFEEVRSIHVWQSMCIGCNVWHTSAQHMSDRLLQSQQPGFGRYNIHPSIDEQQYLNCGLQL